MIRQIRAWYTLLGLGPAKRVANQAMQVFRYAILKVLQDEGLYDYLSQPRTYGDILANFGYADIDYTRELFKLLTEEESNTLISNNGYLASNHQNSPPTLDELMGSTDTGNQNFVLLAEDLAQNIPLRLRQQPVEFKTAFEEKGREMLQSFNTVLGNRLYTISRQTVFKLLTKEDLRYLEGTTLLDIGCGSGREPAELWNHLNGKTRIVAVDPVPSLLAQAERNFESLLDEINPDHPPVTPEMRPQYHEGSATDLPFEPETFDAVFHSHVLHWTLNPPTAIRQIVSVLKPGGLVFGVQTCKPYTSSYTDVIFRSNENCYGFFWKEEFLRWYAREGIQLEIATPVGAFRGRKPE